MLTIKQGDTRNGIIATLTKNGKPADLAGCDVKIYISNNVSGYAEVLEAGKGLVMYPLEPNAVANTGYFVYEFKAIYGDGRQETFPNDGYLKLNIKRSMED